MTVNIIHIQECQSRSPEDRFARVLFRCIVRLWFNLTRILQIQTSLKFEHPVRQAVVAGAEVVVESSQGSTRIVTVHSLSEGKHAKPK